MKFANVITKLLLILTGSVIYFLLSNNIYALTEKLDARSSSQNEVTKLKIGNNIEGDLNGSKSHSYKIDLKEGEYFQAFIIEQGINLIIKVEDPTGMIVKEVYSSDDNKNNESPIILLAEITGTYQIEIIAVEENYKEGKYVLLVDEISSDLSKNRKRVEARNKLSEINQLLATRVKESLEKALVLNEEVIKTLHDTTDLRGEADALKVSGFIHQLLGDHRKALEFYIQALPIFEAVNNMREASGTLSNMGSAYARLGDHNKALEFYKKALPIKISSNDKQGESTVLLNMATSYIILGNNDGAIEVITHASEIAKSLENFPLQAQLLNNLSTIYASKGELLKAFEYCKNSLEIAKKIKNKSVEGLALNTFASLHNRSGEPTLAIEKNNQALLIWQEIGDQNLIGSTLNSIGSNYLNMGDLEKALDNFGQALEIYRKLKNNSEQARALNNLAVIYGKLGDKQRALNFHLQALKIWEQFKNIKDQGTVLANIAVIYQNLANYPAALDYYKQSLSLSKLANNRYSQATTLNNLGTLAKLMNDYDAGLAYLSESLDIATKDNFHSLEPTIIDNIGTIYFLKKDYTKALELHNQALMKNVTVGNRGSQAASLSNLGKVYEMLGDNEQALNKYRQATNILEISGDRDTQTTTYFALAMLEEKRGNLLQAEKEVNNALKLTDYIRANAGATESRTSYFTTVQGIYQFYINLLIQLHHKDPKKGYDEKAFQISEEARARSLLDLLQEARIDFKKGVDINTIAREKKLQQDLTTKANQLSQAEVKKDQELTKQLTIELGSISRQLIEVQTEIRDNSPLRNKLIQQSTINLTKLRDNFLDEHSLLLEFSLGEKQSFLFSISKTKFTIYELPAKAEIEELAEKFYKIITARQPTSCDDTPDDLFKRGKVADKEFSETASLLSKLLLGQVKNLENSAKLIIVPDGKLHLLPFASLLEPKRPFLTKSKVNKNYFNYLILNHEIINLPSVSLLNAIKDNINNREAPPNQMLIIADPVFSKDDSRLINVPITSNNEIAININLEKDFLAIREFVGECGKAPQRLLGTLDEGLGIKSLLNQSTSKLVTGFESSKQLVLSGELSKYRYIHFATHSIFNTLHPELSGIIFTLITKDGKPQDGFLRLHDIYSLKLPADLMVLSACQTGLGQNISGEGIVGLSQGFIYAGVAQLITTQWQINDNISAVLMKEFYKNLFSKNSISSPAALRAAQISILQRKTRNQPYYWAGFTFQGVWK